MLLSLPSQDLSGSSVVGVGVLRRPYSALTAVESMNIELAPSIPYRVIADCFRDHSIALFLGAAASFVGAPSNMALPSGMELAKLLVERSEYPGALSDPLTKVAQYLEEVPADREYILTTVAKHFCEQLNPEYQSSLTQFLAGIPSPLIPRLIITTNYDTLVERVLEERSTPYLAVSHILKGSRYAGRLLCYKSLKTPLDGSNIQTRHQVEDQLIDLNYQGVHPVLIYKMNGTAWLRSGNAMLDSVVLTENDYIDFLAQDILSRIPDTILGLLRASRLLFLGYALEDWNFRVLLRKLQLIQRQDRENPRRHWAFLLAADNVETKFWDKRGVNLYPVSLDVCLCHLAQNLQ
jgi:hypothetical protein